MKQQETWYQVMGKTSGRITMESSGTADFPFPPGFRLCTLPAPLCPKPPFFSATGGLLASHPLHSLFPLHGHCSLPQCHPPTPLHSLHLLFLPLGHSLPQCPPPFFTHCLPSVDIAPYPMSSHSPPYSASLIARICSPVSCSSSFNSQPKEHFLREPHLLPRPWRQASHFSYGAFLFFTTPLGLLLQYMYIFLIIQLRLSVTEWNLSLFLF